MRSRIVSSPEWFPGLHIAIAAAGTLLGIASVAVGAGLLRYARWSARSAVATFGLYSDIHLWTCWELLAAIALHVGGALYHGFRNDGIVRRILTL